MEDYRAIKGSVSKLYDAQQEKKNFDKYYETLRKKEQLSICNFMFTNLPKGQESFEIELDEGITHYTNHTRVRVTKIRRNKILWNVVKLKKKLDKKLYKQVVTKEYTINDMNGLVEYLKSCGVNPKKFKQFIDVDETLNEAELDRLYDTGKITKEQLDGCYVSELSEPYIRLTELKR